MKDHILVQLEDWHLMMADKAEAAPAALFYVQPCCSKFRRAAPSPLSHGDAET